MEDIIKLNNKGFTSLFDDIEPWSESYVAGHKLVWVRCYGLPITLWTKDCLSKVVGEMEELITIDEATEQWENLEYARIQVRVLKSCTVEVSKGYRINGQIFNINIVEEEPSKEGGLCNCPVHHYASSDSISSMDTFIEETIFSEKVFDGGVGDIGATSRRDEKVKEGRKSWPSLETNPQQLKELSKAERECQSKSESHFANLVMREQQNCSNGAALSEPEKVKAICSLIQNLVVDLMHTIQCFNQHSDKPENSTAHISPKSKKVLGWAQRTRELGSGREKSV